MPYAYLDSIFEVEDLGELNLEGIDWIIVGGESGQKARPMNQVWASSIRLQCKSQKCCILF